MWIFDDNKRRYVTVSQMVEYIKNGIFKDEMQIIKPIIK